MKSWRPLLKQLILRCIEDGPKSFDAILQSCHSLSPDILSETLQELQHSKQVVLTHSGYLLTDQRVKRWSTFKIDWQSNLGRARQILAKVMDAIHLPHCLDYEWWFDSLSMELLAHKLLLENPLPSPQSIAFLGSPLLGVFICTLVPETPVWILDKSGATLDVISKCTNFQNLHLIHYNVEEKLPDALFGVAQMAFFDPPWYVEYYDAFLKRCLQITYKHPATISAILFSILTRPRSLQERNEVLTTAGNYGLELFTIQPGLVQYVAPFFENEALKVAGFPGGNWRKGDLTVFLSDGMSLPTEELLTLEPFKWKETLIGRVKVKVKIKSDEPEDKYVEPFLLPLGSKNSIIQSVSRRDPSRDKVDLWTSTQLGLQIRGWRAIWRIVEGIARSQEVSEIISNICLDYEEIGIDVNPTEDIKNSIISVWQELSNLLIINK